MKKLRLALVAASAFLGCATGKVHAQALNFGAYSYITLGDILSDNQSYTKEAWIRVHTYYTTHGANIFSAWDHPFWLENGVLKAGNGYGFTSTPTVADNTQIPLMTWTHVAVTYDATTSTMKLYKNGSLIATSTQAPTYIASVMQIGAQNFGDFFDGGDIDEVRLWNSARSQSQIQSAMNCDVPQQSGLIAYYRLNQGTVGGDNTALVNSVYDYSGNANCGSMMNFNLTGTSSNYITGAIGSCSSISVVTTAPAAISGASSVCTGSAITLSNSVSGGAWVTDDIDTASVGADGTVTGLYPGVVSITYKTCGGTASKTITVNPSPEVSLTAATGAITTAVTGGTSPYTYSWSNSSTSANLTGLASGTYSVTVTDAKGCKDAGSTYVSGSATTLTNTIAITPCSKTYTGCDKRKMFIGYGSTCYTLTANPTGASSFTYSWAPTTYLSSSTSKSVTFTPTATGQYTYTCTATNNGNSVSATVTITVSDARHTGCTGKVYVCHHSGWNHGTHHNISMKSGDVANYLKKNPYDHVHNGGTCTGAKSTIAPDQDGMILVGNELSVTAFPNPYADELTVRVSEVNAAEQVNVVVFDMTGRAVASKQGTPGASDISVGKGLPSGMYIVEVVKGGEVKKISVVKGN